MAKQLYEEAVKFGSVKLSIIKCLVLGIAGVGKTCLKRLLLHLPQNIDGPIGRVSTGLADNPIQVLVGSVSSILVNVIEGDIGKWEVLDETKLMQVVASAYHVNASPSSTPPPTPKWQSASINESVHDNVEFQCHHMPTTSYPIKMYASKIASESENPLDPVIEEVDSILIEVFKNKILDWKELNVKLVQFIDSGGQSQFLHLLPAFVQDLSAILYAVNLSEPLDHHPMIYFYGHDCQPLGEPYQSPSSHRQVLHQCVRATYTGDVHPHVFVVGTHRDKENECAEKKKDKDIIIEQIVPPECLLKKNESEVIWAVNGIEPDSNDQGVANTLRTAIVKHCSKDDSLLLPMTWFVLEMQINKLAVKGVLSLRRCLDVAQRLGLNDVGLEAALLHMVKYNLFLWYHKIPELRDVVISDPQVILKIITLLVQCKHNLAALSNDAGIKGIWRTKFKDHAIVSHDFLSQDYFKKHLIEGVFTVEHFTALMCHLFIMVDLKNGDYLMPTLLDPLCGKQICWPESQLVEPLLICFSNEIVPYGLFSCLVAFLLTKCSLVEENKVPVCLYRDCVSFRDNECAAQFTIVDSVAYIEIKLEMEEGWSKVEDYSDACLEIKQLINEGIEKSSAVLRYSGWKDMRYGFICSNHQPVKHAAIPCGKHFKKAACQFCPKTMALTSKHTVWLLEKECASGMFHVIIESS